MIKLNAKELRTTVPDAAAAKSIKRNPITIILDNVLDTYNVGSIFRLADAVAAEKVILCGQTLTPPNSRIKKASINTWQWVEWEYRATALEAVAQCKMLNAKCQIIAVEQDKRSKPFYKVTYKFPLAIVVGNETYGVSKDVLDMADMIVELPMWGINKSLNVMVSCGIILYEIMKRQTTSENIVSR
ncbi:TrmH family RNA methyltransferase [Candidatus Gottesmanbacteria bacterium]|nr:TrmH family RNA methyltransferase [Candidatus Gottesmanbacteria bacterium]